MVTATSVRPARPDALGDLLGTPAGPAPSGRTLRFPVACSADRSGSHPHRHHVHEATLGPDWRLETPHDLEAERVAEAFGGSLTCLDLDRAVPTVRRWIGLELRRTLPRLHHGRLGWSASTVGCCGFARRPFHTAAEAGGHLRDLHHLCREDGADLTAARMLADAVGEAHGFTGKLPFPQLEGEIRCVPRLEDLEHLWAAGVPPHLVEHLHARAGCVRPLALDYWLGVLTRRPDVVALASSDFGDATWAGLATWLGWTQTATDLSLPEARRDWLAYGAPHQVIQDLVAAGYVADDATALAAGSARTRSAALTCLTSWARSGCHPDATALVRLHLLGVARSSAPSADAVSRVREALPCGAVVGDDPVAGLMLAVAGTVADAAAWLRHGHGDPFAVAALIAAGRTPADTSTRQAGKP